MRAVRKAPAPGTRYADLMLLAAAFVLAAATGPVPSLPHCADAPLPPAAPAPTSTAVRVMMLDLEGAGPNFGVARALGQVVAAEAAQAKGLEILSADEVRAVLQNEANKQLMGCDDASCLSELADAMDADLLVSGSLDETTGAPVLTLSLVNTRALVVVNRATLAWPGDPARLPDVARAAAQLLVFEKAQRPPATIVVANAPPGAQVYVDGFDRTADAATGKIGGLDAGVHEVRVVALDMEPKTEHVVVTAGGSAQVDGALESVPVFASSWFWLGAGAAVVTGVVATAAGLYLAGNSDVSATATVPAYDLSDVEALRGVR